MLEIKRRKIFERDSKSHSSLNNSTEKHVSMSMDEDLMYKGGKFIQKAIASKEISRESYFLASILRTRQIGRFVLNAVTEEVYDEALLSAQNFENGAGKNSSLGNCPLRGLPISVKECIIQKNCDTTFGCVSRCFKPSKADELIVDACRTAGLIPFVRTNVPQQLLLPETENDLWGITNNPYDLKRTPGGSSGGEGALIASGCSVIGIGSDIGGSIRIPAHFCGIVGFKPTPQRMTHVGGRVPRVGNRNGQLIIKATSGPMARTVDDCMELMKVLTSSYVHERDSSIPPLPFKDPYSFGDTTSPTFRKLKIAYMESDGFFEPVDACKRAVQISVKALQARGHEVIPFQSPVSGEKVFQTYTALMNADGNFHNLVLGLEGDELYTGYKALKLYTELPNFLRGLVAFILRLFGEHRKAAVVSQQRSGGLNVRQYWEVAADMVEIEKKMTEAFIQEGFDALILPPVACVATPHTTIRDLLFALSYTFLANLLHWPAGVVPVTLVREDEQKYDIEKIPTIQRDSIAKVLHQSMQSSEGLPVGVQVITKRWSDELCLYVMSEIEQGVDFKGRPQFK
mmetsp:Transcript_1480/g.2057  ORF Transcript_1480/g.2057 Transcript_1480/m.2057 type:complete len:571 (+) Transcript_1480:90-1802(+)